MNINIGKIGCKGELKEVRIVPKLGNYIIEVIMQIESEEPKVLNLNNIAGIDLGVNNFVTMTNNVDLPPILIKGNVIKSSNQIYNKL